MSTSFGEELCFGLSRWLVRQRRYGTSGVNASFDPTQYQQWRGEELRRQFDTYFHGDDIVGRDVLDFGCGHGELSFYVAGLGAKSVVGIEAAPDRYLAAVANGEESMPSKGCQPQFQLSTDAGKIDLPTSSIDTILCFDVLEHVMDYEPIVKEWSRVLRPGGNILIWWVPWWNPYGPHIQYLVPIPWCHVFFSDRTLLNACARIYDSADYEPRHWDTDASGTKKPNPWRNAPSLPNINKLTMRRFELLCRATGLEIERKNLVGFGNARTLSGWKAKLGQLTEAFLHIPYVQEMLTLHVTYRVTRTDQLR